jgi:hypothetical protein
MTKAGCQQPQKMLKFELSNIEKIEQQQTKRNS